VIFWILWKVGARALRARAHAGIVFAWYLMLSGVARFLIEFIRINPRSFLGMSNAQAASLVSILVGAVLFAVVRHRPAATRRA
jgi:phosphatidylglycerol:prolipoprotein diacylglycerol transferase